MQTTIPNKTRNYHIDALKGYAIILVVLGHSVQTAFTNFDENIVFRIIYSFHMPLFFFLAGFIAWGRQVDIGKKFINLAIPFIIWHQIEYILRIIRTHQIPDYKYHLISWIKSPDFGLWFLWILFLCFIVLKIIQVLSDEKKWWHALAIAWLVIAFIKDIPTSFFGLGLLKWEMPFFIIGYFTSQLRQFIPLKIFIKTVSLLAFPLMAWIWQRTAIPQDIQNVINQNHFPGIQYLSSAYLLLTPLAGISFFYTVIPKMGGWWHESIRWLGQHSLEIYVIHQSILYGMGASWIRVGTAFLIGLYGSLIIAQLLKRWVPILAKTIFGPSRVTTNSM